MPDGQSVWLVGLENDDDQFVITDNIVQVWFYATEEAARRKLMNLKVPPGAKPIIEETGPANHYVRGYRLTEDGEWVPPHALKPETSPEPRWRLADAGSEKKRAPAASGRASGARQ